MDEIRKNGWKTGEGEETNLESNSAGLAVLISKISGSPLIASVIRNAFQERLNSAVLPFENWLLITKGLQKERTIGC